MHSRLRAFVSNTPIKLIAVILITILAPSVIVTALGLVAVLQADSFVRDRFSRPLRDKMQRLERRLEEDWSRRLHFYSEYVKDAPQRLSRLRDLPMSDDHVKDVIVSDSSAGLAIVLDPPPRDLWSPEAEEDLKEVHRLEVLEKNYPAALAECQKVLSRAADEAVVAEALLAAARLSYLLRNLDDAERYLRSAAERFGDTVDATGMVRAVPILCRIAEIEKELGSPQRLREAVGAYESTLERYSRVLAPETAAFFRRKLASLKDGTPGPAETAALPPVDPARVPASALEALEPLLARRGSAQPGPWLETHATVPVLGEVDFVSFPAAGRVTIHLLLDREVFRAGAASIASGLGLPDLGLVIASPSGGAAVASPASEVLASRLPAPFTGYQLQGTLPREALPQGFRGFNIISLATFSWAVIILVLAIVAGVLFTLQFVVRETRTARLKSDFVSFISHELKTPLTSIRMFTETMLSGRVEDEEEKKFCVQMIDRESDRLSKLIDQVLEYSRIERQQKEFKFTSCDMEDVVREAVRLFQDLHRKEPRDIEVNAVQRISKIRMDRAAMVELFLNLLSNAAKYSPPEKKIVLNVRESIDDISVEVVDHGVGIRKRDQKRIFEKFFRADDYLTREVEGTGLGLTFARYIAKVHNGDIKVSSQPSSGSTFTLQLRKSHVLAE